MKRVEHGAYADRLVDGDAAFLLAHLRARGVSWLDDCDEAALGSWLRAEARARRVAVRVAEIGEWDDEDRPRPLADLLTRLERAAERAQDRLGLSPLARARIRRDLAASPPLPQSVEDVIAAMGGPEVGA